MGSSITMFSEPKVPLNLNTWTLLSDVLGVNDTDGDTIQAIRFENTGTDTLSYSLVEEDTSIVMSPTTSPHSKMSM